MTKLITMSTEVSVRLTLRMYKINPSYADPGGGGAGRGFGPPWKSQINRVP